MTKSLASAILLGAACTAATAAEPAFRYSKTLELPELNQEELLGVTLDSDVYAVTRDGLPDLRIRAADNRDISYVLRKVTTTKSESTRDFWPANEPAVKPLENDALEITFQLDKDDPQPQGLRIVTPLHNFEQRVRVFSSPDGKAWQPLGDEAVIFDYAQFMDVQSDVVSFPATSDRYFRIVIDNVTQELESQLMELTRRLRGSDDKKLSEKERDERIVIERRPFRIDSIEFWREIIHDRVTGDAKVAYPIANLKSEFNEKLKQTILTFDSRREPLTSLKLVTKSNNFSRQALVEIDVSTPTEHTWRSIGSATVSGLDFGNIKREDLAISFPETRQTKYRIVIDNRGSAPLEISGIAAEGNDYELVFFSAVPEEPCKLLYGSDDAPPPDYDTAAITASLDAGYQPKLVALGSHVEAASVPPLPFSFSRLINNPLLLGAVAVVLVAALGWGLFRAGSRLDSLSQDDR